MEIIWNLNQTIKMMIISRKMMRARNLCLLKGIFQTKKKPCRKNNSNQSSSNLSRLLMVKFWGKRVKIEKEINNEIGKCTGSLGGWWQPAKKRRNLWAYIKMISDYILIIFKIKSSLFSIVIRIMKYLSSLPSKRSFHVFECIKSSH